MLIPESEQAAWDEIPPEMLPPRKVARTCSSCAHDGQCDGLPFCGGNSWEAQEEEGVEE